MDEEEPYSEMPYSDVEIFQAFPDAAYIPIKIAKLVPKLVISDYDTSWTSYFLTSI